MGKAGNTEASDERPGHQSALRWFGREEFSSDHNRISFDCPRNSVQRISFALRMKLTGLQLTKSTKDVKEPYGLYCVNRGQDACRSCNEDLIESIDSCENSVCDGLYYRPASRKPFGLSNSLKEDG